jgi:hypothetical protein
VGRDGHRVAEEAVLADLRRRRDGPERAVVDGLADRVVALVVVDELTTVGETGRGLLHVRGSSPPTQQNQT